MNTNELIEYYNKFNEDKRLERRHGQIEFRLSNHYIDKYLKKYNNPKIIDIGAGTGKYSIRLFNMGYDVTSVELVKHNLMVIKKNSPKLKSYLGNAVDLSNFKDNSYDITILFGPMYHLISYEEKLKALSEAKRITKENGLIFISYCTNDFAVIKHGFMDNNILSEINTGRISKNFKITPKNTDLYSFVSLKEINKLKNDLKLKRVKIINQDGPTEYMRSIINKMDDETFNLFYDYVLSIAERKDLLSSGRHILDILRK